MKEPDLPDLHPRGGDPGELQISILYIQGELAGEQVPAERLYPESTVVRPRLFQKICTLRI